MVRKEEFVLPLTLNISKSGCRNFQKMVRFDDVLDFFKAYIKSMRLYYAFVTGIAGWIGVAFYEYIATSPFHTVEMVPAMDKKALILAMLFLSWGMNQIINDYLGLREDRAVSYTHLTLPTKRIV